MFLISLGALKFLKRNHVKLHDNVLKIIQDREEEKKQREIMMDLICDLREEVKLQVGHFS